MRAMKDFIRFNYQSIVKYVNIYLKYLFLFAWYACALFLHKMTFCIFLQQLANDKRQTTNDATPIVGDAAIELRELRS